MSVLPTGAEMMICGNLLFSERMFFQVSPFCLFVFSSHIIGIGDKRDQSNSEKDKQ